MITVADLVERAERDKAFADAAARGGFADLRCLGYVYVGTATLPCPECHPEHWDPGTTRASLGYPPHKSA